MEQYFTRLPFWEALTEQEKESVRNTSSLRRYKKGSFIRSGGSECLGMLLLLEGELRTYLLSDEGREVTLFRIYHGELCVLSASCVTSRPSSERR